MNPIRDVEFNLFAYGTLRDASNDAGLLSGCTRVGNASVRGTLYDLVDFPALMMYGETTITGTVWCCPAALLPALDANEAMADGLFRRSATAVRLDNGDELPCWVYVAGPRLARMLTPEAALTTGTWSS
ncbi:MAG: gamma-glutamylcyclotransferase family protein [Longimicrobiales bacterium]